MKTIKRALMMFVVLSLLVCGVYPMVVMGIAHLFFPYQSGGELMTRENVIIGSELIGQEFSSEKYFWSRPSAGQYNAMASTGSNYALTNADHQNAIAERRQKGLDLDLLTTSASGLDPHISPSTAFFQAVRVAKARGMEEEKILRLIRENIEFRQWGFLGEERVNVLKLNVALESITHE